MSDGGRDDGQVERAVARPVVAPRTAPESMRISRLRGPQLVLALLLVALVVVVPVAQGVRAVRAGWHPVGDNALIGIRAHDLFHDPPTLGQPTSADSLGATVTSAHPGPIESYLLAPGVALLGPRLGMLVSVVALQATVLGLAVVLALRRGGLALGALVVLGVLLAARAVDPSQLHDPINSDLATFALVPLVLSAWAVGEGDLAWTPVTVALSTLVVQVHLANAPFALAAAVVGLVGVVRVLRRSGAPRLPIPVLVAIGVLVVLWLPPLLHELGGASSNVAALWESAVADRPVVGTGFALGWIAVAVAPVPLPFFARASRGAPPDGLPSMGVVTVGLLLLGAAGSLAVVARRRGAGAPARLLAVVVAATVAAALAAGRLPWTGVVRPEHARWVSSAGALVWIAILWMGWRLLPPARRRTLLVPVTSALAVVSLVVAVAVVQSPPLRQNSGAWFMPRADGFVDAIRGAVPAGSYRLEPRGSVALLTVVPAVALGLDEHGYRTFVDESSLTAGFDARHFLRGRRVDGTIVVVAVGEGDVPSGGRLIAESTPAPGAEGDAGRTLQAFLVTA